MGTILQAIFTGLFLFIGNKYFPEYVSYDQTSTMIIAIISQLVFAIILGLLLVAIVVVIYKCFQNNMGLAIIGTLIIVLMGFLFNAFVLFLMNKFIPGLHINGILPYVIYGFVVAIIGSATSKRSK